MTVRALGLAALVGCSALALGGCVAAIVPVAAGGLIGHKQLQGHRKPHRPNKRERASAAPVATPAAAPPAAVMPAVQPVPLPADASAMKVGTLYTGQLPTPGGAPTQGVPRTDAVAVAASSDAWVAVVHYVASASLNPPAKSVLLVRGSTAATPIWAPCDQKPLAVVIDLDAVAADHAASSIGAIETMGLTPVYTSRRDVAAALAQAKAFSGQVMTAPIEGKTLFLARPGGEGAVRATIAAHYCTIALIGTRPVDFPNAMLPSAPGASPGWFLLPGGS